MKSSSSNLELGNEQVWVLVDVGHFVSRDDSCAQMTNLCLCPVLFNLQMARQYVYFSLLARKNNERSVEEGGVMNSMRQ
jgi:hypothetical protein